MPGTSAAASASAVPIPELAVDVRGAAPVKHAAAPTVAFALHIESRGQPEVRSVLLDVQVQIAARRRAYEDVPEERMLELFGPRPRWGTTLRTLLWTRTTTVVTGFSGSTDVELPIPCTYDLDVTASRYFDAMAGGDAPLEFLFSGTVFYPGPGGLLQVVRIPWELEADYRMPVAVWKDTMELHFPGTGWLRLRKDVIDRLAGYKARNALATWEDALDAVLTKAEEG